MSSNNIITDTSATAIKTTKTELMVEQVKHQEDPSPMEECNEQQQIRDKKTQDQEQYRQEQEQEQPSTISSSNDITASTSTSIDDDDDDDDDEESSSSSSSTSATASQDNAQEDFHDDVAIIRRSIAKGLMEILHERTQIEEEVHGIQSMGISQEEEAKPHVKALFLKQFKDQLETTLKNANATTVKADAVASPLSPTDTVTPSTSPASVSSFECETESTTIVSTTAYELCLRKKYTYATNETGELRLMCLRADMWDPKKACERFIRHLTALHKYFGEIGLKQPLTIERLDCEECNKTIAVKSSCGTSSSSSSSVSSSTSRGIYKKGKGGSKRKGSHDSLPDMLALKSGLIQVLPSRDRAGRRVVVLQPPGLSQSTSATNNQQTQTHEQVQHSKVSEKSS